MEKWNAGILNVDVQSVGDHGGRGSVPDPTRDA